MPQIEQVLRDRILANPTVSGLIHGTISPLNLPEKPSYPAITYNRVSTTRDRLLSGQAALVESRFQFTIFDPSYATVRLVASGVRMQLDGWQATTLENEHDLFDEEARVPYAVMDFNVIYNEESPEPSTSSNTPDLSTYGSVVAASGSFSHSLTVSGIPVMLAGDGGVTDHGALTGLADDDHPQYGALAQAESVSGAWNFSNSLTVSGVPVVTTTLGHTLTVTFAAQVPAGSTFTNMPAGLQSIFSNSFGVQKVDLTHYRQARLMAIRTSAVTTAAPNSYLFLGSNTTSPGTFSTTPAEYTSIDGAPHGTKVLISGTPSNMLISPWVDIAPNKRGDYDLYVIGSGGDGSLDPAFGVISAQFRT